jgi:hypothetical protein
MGTSRELFFWTKLLHRPAGTWEKMMGYNFFHFLKKLKKEEQVWMIDRRRKR